MNINLSDVKNALKDEDLQLAFEDAAHNCEVYEWLEDGMENDSDTMAYLQTCLSADDKYIFKQAAKAAGINIPVLMTIIADERNWFGSIIEEEDESEEDDE